MHIRKIDSSSILLCRKTDFQQRTCIRIPSLIQNSGLKYNIVGIRYNILGLESLPYASFMNYICNSKH